MRHPGSLLVFVVALLAACGGQLVEPVGPDGGSVVIDDRPGQVGDAPVTCTSPSGQSLRPGASYDDGCNVCFCQTTGNLACTRRACADGGVPSDASPTWDGGRPDVVPRQDGGYVDAPRPWDGGRPDGGPAYCDLPNGGYLTPGQSYYDGCNSCYCDVNGRLGCTTRACDDAGPPDVRPDAGTYCYLPDGRAITPGQSYYDGCNTCTCQREGMLSCTEIACYDAGPPVDAGAYCQAPDGSLLVPGQVWSQGCSRCYCQAGGMIACSRDACYDAGPPPPVDAGQCNALSLAGVSPPEQAWSSGSPPRPTGGTIVDGRYELRTVTTYGPQPYPARLGATVLQVSRGVLDVASAQLYSAVVDRATYWYMAAGTSVTIVGVCGRTSMPSTTAYTATARALLIYDPTTRTVMSFVRR